MVMNAKKRLPSGASKVALALLAALLAGAGLLLSPAGPANGGPAEGVSYIRAHQASDGGFFEPGREERGQDPLTAWCIMALRAAGVDPASVRRGGRSPVDFLATQSGNWRSVTDYERTLLAAAAAGADPRSFGGVDLVEKVLSSRRPSGNIGDGVNTNAFGILALVSAGLEPPAGSVSWQKAAQNADGGWGNSPGAASNPDMTAASIMALRAAGVPAGDPAVAAGLSYLRSLQAPDGGFSFQAGSSDASATAWCVQAILAVGQDPGGAEWSKEGATPLGYLLSMQEADGHFRWTAGRDMNPVWTTSYAVCALAGKPFPVAAVPAPSPSGADGAEGQAEEGNTGTLETILEPGQPEDQAVQGEKSPEKAQENTDLSASPETVRPEGYALAGKAQEKEGKGAPWAWWLGGALGALALAAAALLALKPSWRKAVGGNILRIVKK